MSDRRAQNGGTNASAPPLRGGRNPSNAPPLATVIERVRAWFWEQPRASDHDAVNVSSRERDRIWMIVTSHLRRLGRRTAMEHQRAQRIGLGGLNQGDRELGR